jgi:hypothetical protein
MLLEPEFSTFISADVEERRFEANKRIKISINERIETGAIFILFRERK